MKKLMILMVITGLSIQVAKAQGVPSGALGGCAIKYDYDAAGNRIKRSKYCWTATISNKPSGTTSIDDKVVQKEMLIELYPNPANESCTVSITQKIENGSIELQDIAGKIIYKKDISNTTNVRFDISALAQGSYIIVVSDLVHQQKWVKKLIKD